jgi:pimeloyl-ACP methyl ester carboxylesterase
MGSEHVILLHGICCTPFFMRRVERKLAKEGFITHNTGYPSRKAPVAQLADAFIGPTIRQCEEAGAEKIHFVTHSMGGILVRSYLSRNPHPPSLGKVVMLAPPNQGSEVADFLQKFRAYRWFTGAAGQELGTDAASVPCRLPAANFEVGIIAGTRTCDWLSSRFLLPGPNDGKVSVESTRLAGMRDHLVLPVSHTFITRNSEALRQTVYFLRHGAFERGT